MSKKQTDKPKRGAQVKDLPEKEKELTKDQQKEVQSGIQGSGIVILSSTEDEKETELIKDEQKEVEDGIQGRGIVILSSTEETPKL